VQSIAQTGETAKTSRVAGLGRTEATHGQIASTGEAISSTHGAKDTTRHKAKVVRPGRTRNTDPRDSPPLTNPKASAAPLLPRREGHNQMPPKLEHPAILARRRPTRKHPRVHQQPKTPAKPRNDLSKEAVNPGLPGVASRAVRMPSGTGLGQKVSPAIAGPTVKTSRPAGRGSLDRDVGWDFSDTKGDPGQLAHSLSNRPPYGSIRLVRSGNTKKVGETINCDLRVGV
jgi:hypothetical protein